MEDMEGGHETKEEPNTSDQDAAGWLKPPDGSIPMEVTMNVEHLKQLEKEGPSASHFSKSQ